MSYAIELRMGNSNVPNDALQRVQTVKTNNRPILGPNTDDPQDQETTLKDVPEDTAYNIPAHYLSLLRFHENDDPASIASSLAGQFPGVPWLVIKAHNCRHEWVFEEYADDPQYPDGTPGDCPDWTVVQSRGNVPSEFL